MALAIQKENYILHKLHSLTGVIPVGYYMAQHLLLNSFAFAGPEKFDGVIEFFEGMPKFFLLALEVFAIWTPLVFHSVYGLFITSRAKQNFIGTKYGWSQNRMFLLQRITGILITLFLIYHVISTTGYKYYVNDAEVIKYAAWKAKLSANGYLLFFVYLLGVTVSSYHLAYGIWNFCIRWGITISDKAQVQVQKISLAVFVALTALGTIALVGLVRHDPKPAEPVVAITAPSSVH